jgi:predicted transcriptional regulator
MKSDFDNVLHALIAVQERDKKLHEAVEATRAANRELGEALREYRVSKGVSLRAVATHLKLSAPFVSDCELGRRTLSDKHREAYLNFLQPGRNLRIRESTEK